MCTQLFHATYALHEYTRAIVYSICNHKSIPRVIILQSNKYVNIYYT